MNAGIVNKYFHPHGRTVVVFVNHVGETPGAGADKSCPNTPGQGETPSYQTDRYQIKNRGVNLAASGYIYRRHQG